MRKAIPLYLTLLTAAFAPLIEGGTTHLPVFILRALVLLLLVLYLTGSTRRGELVFHGSPLDLGVGIFLLTALFSAVIAPYKNMAMTWVQLVLYYALFFYLARDALSVPGSVRRATVVVLGMGAVESLAGLTGRLAGGYRAAGTFFNPNMLAGYITPALLLALSLLIFKAGRGSLARKAALAAIFLLGLSAVILTGSRGGAVSLCAGLFVVMWVRSRGWALLVSAALAALLLTVPNPVKERVFSDEPFAYSRSRIWAGAARMMAEHPLGVGLGNFKYAWPAYNFPVEEAVVKYGKMAGTAHNEYLHIGAEMGFAGLGAFFFGVFCLARTVRRSVKYPAEYKDRAVAAGLAGGITAVMTHAFFDSNLHEPGIVFLLILMAAMAVEVSKEGRARDKVFDIPGGARTRLAVLAGALVLVMAAWAAIPAAAFYLSQEGNRLLKAKRPAEALSMVERARMLEPGNASHHNLTAAILYRLYLEEGRAGLLEDALKELDEAGRLNPVEGDYPAMAAKVKHSIALGLKEPGARRAMLESALGDMARARRLSPYDAGIIFEQARINLALGEPGKAAAGLDELRGFEPNFLAGRLMLAGLYKGRGSYGLARTECYNIMSVHEGLKKAALSRQETEFTAVDVEEVRRLLASMEGMG